MSLLQRSLLKKICFSLAAVLLAIFCLLIAWARHVDHQIQQGLAQGWFSPPVELYSLPLTLRERWSLPQSFEQTLDELQFQRAPAHHPQELQLRDRQYAVLDQEGCRLFKKFFSDADPARCFVLQWENSDLKKSQMILAPLDSSDKVLALLRASSLQQLIEATQEGFWSTKKITTTIERLQSIELPKKLLAQYYGEEPLLKKIIRLGDVPLSCSQAITVTEDSAFLEHEGVQWTGLFRAFIKNIASGRYAQGGSTITQQLVKNYFLTHEKTLRRKLSELFMALRLETRATKDEILEAYFNIIYMGQRGPFQVRGIAAASEYYFNKNIQDLEVHECALIAAIINSPGRYNPFSKPENAKYRREFILKKMAEKNFINTTELTTAMAQPLPMKPAHTLAEPAPYYVQAVLKELEAIAKNNSAIKIAEGLIVETALNDEAQDKAQRMLQKHISLLLEKNQKSRSPLTPDLQAAMIVVDLHTQGLIALVGGHQFQRAPFNRATQSRRQVGSVFKPFVFLTALEGQKNNGEKYTPLTLIDDSPFEHKYSGQKWSPRNYTRESYGRVPLFFALNESLNISTARLGLEVGLNNIIEVARRAGVQSPLDPVPSLTLGSFEMTPLEVAQSYSTLAHFGVYKPLRMIYKIKNLNGEILFDSQSSIEKAREEKVMSEKPVAQLISMMKQNLISGTGRSAQSRGWDRAAAGKTGSTSDNKDAWYVGFTPYTLALVWVGYDDNKSTGLTGATGALPLWLDFMLDWSRREPDTDFLWPITVKKHSVDLYGLFESSSPNARAKVLNDKTQNIELVW